MRHASLAIRPYAAFIVFFTITFVADSHADVVLNPKFYSSPDESYRLDVNPYQPDGSGPGHHKLSHNGKIAWESDLDYTLWDAVVADSGAVAGFAYANGFDGRQFRGRGQPNLIVVILNSDGTERMRDVRERRHPGVMSTPPSPFVPLVDAVLLDEQHDRFIVQERCAFGDDSCKWWVYEFSTGTKIGDIVPDQPESHEFGFHSLMHIEMVPGKPLVAVHWQVYRSGSRAAQFELLNLDGTRIWKFDIPGEYDVLDRRAVRRLGQSPSEPQFVVHADEFKIRSYKLEQQITIELNANGETDHAWTVREVHREPFDLDDPPLVASPLSPEFEFDLEHIDLKRLADVQLETGVDAEPAIGGILNFAIDAEGRIGFIRRRGSALQTHFVLVTDKGKTLLEVPFDWPDGTVAPIAGVTGAGKWIVIRHTYDRAATRADAWWINRETGAKEPIEGGIPLTTPDSIAPIAGGGFAAASSRVAMVFDERGQKLQTLDVNLPDGVAPRTSGGVAVLTASPCIAHLFDSDGNPDGQVNLSEQLGIRWCFGSMWVDRNGNVLLRHNGEPEKLYRVAPNGEVLDRLTVRGEDGGTFTFKSIQCDPEGNLWTTDGDSLYRLTDDGTVDRVLGQQPDEDTLHDIKDLAIGADGRIYALNDRTNAVHVFDVEGQLLRVLRPAPNDFGAGGEVGPIAVADDGWVFIGHTTREMFSSYRYLEFDPNGQRVEFAQLGLDGTREQWLFRADTHERWVVGYKAVYLVDENGNTITTLRRRPDNQWFETISDAAVAPNGSLLVASRQGNLFSYGGNHWLSVFHANGSGVITVNAPAHGAVAWSGRFAIVIYQDDLLLLDTAGAQWRRMKIEGDDNSWWHPVVGPEGQEVWLWNRDSTTLHRYALPVR